MKNHQTLKNHGANIIPGTVIEGKWYQNRYIVKRKLGSGAIGSVYLCEWQNRSVALKISQKSSSMLREVNVLKALSKVQGKKLGPSLLDVDDWGGDDGENMTFYAMEYIEGESIHGFIHKRGVEWIGVFVLQLLDSLEALHQAGWVFGDFKTDNLLITKSPARVRWIDVGGTTQMGRAIKEYTAFYDRAHWGLGSRRAEASYDLFALVMTVLHVCYPNHFAKGSHPEQTLLRRLRAVKPLYIYYKPFKNAIEGRYNTSREMREDIKTVIYQAQKRRKNKQRRRPIPVQSIWTESAGIFLLAGVYYLASFLF